MKKRNYYIGTQYNFMFINELINLQQFSHATLWIKYKGQNKKIEIKSGIERKIAKSKMKYFPKN